MEILDKFKDAESAWLFLQIYDGDENQATEALLKWFCYSTTHVQSQFLRKLCQVRRVPRKKLTWDQLDLQVRARDSVPDAAIRLKEKYLLLVEGKVRQNVVSRKQIRKHLKRAGFRPNKRMGERDIILLLITPDWEPPKQLADLPEPYRERVVWRNWQRIYYFVDKELHTKNSADRLLQGALLDFLLTHSKLSRVLS